MSSVVMLRAKLCTLYICKWLQVRGSGYDDADYSVRTYHLHNPCLAGNKLSLPEAMSESLLESYISDIFVAGHGEAGIYSNIR